MYVCCMGIQSIPILPVLKFFSASGCKYNPEKEQLVFTFKI